MKVNKWLYIFLFLFTLVFMLPYGTASQTVYNHDDEILPNDDTNVGLVCVVGDLVEINYTIKSGPGLNVWFCKEEALSSGVPPSSYIYRDMNSKRGSWSYTVESNDTYSLVFKNPSDEKVSFSWDYRVTHKMGSTSTTNPSNVIPFGSIYFIIFSIGTISVILLIKSRNKFIIKK